MDSCYICLCRQRMEQRLCSPINPMDKYSKLPKPMDMKESKFSAKKTEIWSISTQTRLMSSVKRYFDDRATTYLSQSSRGFWSILREKEKVAIQQTLKPFSKMACLELGSGSGYYYVTASDLAQSTAYQQLAGAIYTDNDASMSGILHVFSPSSTNSIRR